MYQKAGARHVFKIIPLKTNEVADQFAGGDTKRTDMCTGKQRSPFENNIFLRSVNRRITLGRQRRQGCNDSNHHTCSSRCRSRLYLFPSTEGSMSLRSVTPSFGCIIPATWRMHSEISTGLVYSVSIPASSLRMSAMSSITVASSRQLFRLCRNVSCNMENHRFTSAS